MSDLLYPNDGQVAGIYEVPEDERQTKLAKAEDTAIALSLPVIEDAIAWFDEQIGLTDSLANIDRESAVPIESQMLAYQKLAELLTIKRNEYQSKLDAFEANRKERASGTA